MNVGQQLDAIIGRGQTMEMVTSAAGVTGKTFKVLVVNVAATFTTLTDSSGQNMLSAASSGGHNLSGVSVQAGMIISANAGRTIAAVTLSAGSVLGITMQRENLTTAI